MFNKSLDSFEFEQRSSCLGEHVLWLPLEKMDGGPKPIHRWNGDIGGQEHDRVLPFVSRAQKRHFGNSVQTLRD